MCCCFAAAPFADPEGGSRFIAYSYTDTVQIARERNRANVSIRLGDDVRMPAAVFNETIYPLWLCGDTRSRAPGHCADGLKVEVGRGSQRQG